jgi:CheY-like chemotaxis protein
LTSIAPADNAAHFSEDYGFVEDSVLSFPIDTATEHFHNSEDLLTVNGKTYLSFLNKYNSTVYIYDIATGQPTQKRRHLSKTMARLHQALLKNISSMKKATPYILLAEDDHDDRDFFIEASMALHPQRPVKHVKDGKHLFEFLDSCPRDDLPNLILLDYSMPFLTAPEALQQLSASIDYAHIPTIIWSSSRRSKDINECLQLGANLYLHKPTDAKELNDLIGRINQLFFTRSNNTT